MKNIYKFTNISAIEKAAAEWLIKLDGEKALSKLEQDQLEEWVGRSSAHREQLLELADLWGKMNVLTELAVPLEQPKQQSIIQQFSLNFSPILTMLVLGLMVGVFFWNTTESIIKSNGLYATAVGGQESIELSDGSTVLLNTNTQIKVAYSEKFRDIYLLQGEIHFTVAKNPKMPFRVFAGNGRIDAIGTAFSVRLKQDWVDVMVTEGEVALATVSIGNQMNDEGRDKLYPEEGKVLAKNLGSLKAGQEGKIKRLNENESEHKQLEDLHSFRDVEEKELSNRLSWMKGVLVFSGEPLEEVVKELSRYTTLTIEFSDPGVGAIRVGGLFAIGETEEMFESLEATFGLDVTYLSKSRVLVSAN